MRSLAMTIVDDLLASPGLYIGKDTAVGRDLVGAARILVSALPGGAGVSLDDEILNGLAPGPVLGHVEHTLSVPGPGRLRHVWWYGSPGEAPVERGHRRAGDLCPLMPGGPNVTLSVASLAKRELEGRSLRISGKGLRRRARGVAPALRA
jgi:hypothetical protein